MRRTHTSLWIKHLHNTVIWKCTLCGLQKPKSYESEEELLVHMERAHDEIEEAELRDIARSSRVPESRPVNACPICGDSHLPQRLHTSEESMKLADDVPPSHKGKTKQKKKAGVRFDTPDDPIQDTKVDSASRKDIPPETSQEMKDHDRIEKYVGKHLQALAYYFSNLLMDDREDHQDSSAGKNSVASSNELEEVSEDDVDATPLKFEYDEDPPKFPVYFPDDHHFTDEEAELIGRNRHELQETWNWNSRGRVSEPALMAEELEQMFPDTYRRDMSTIWQGVPPEQALVIAALIFLGMEFCKKMISNFGNEKRKGIRIRDSLSQDINAFVIGIEGVSGPIAGSSGHVRVSDILILRD